MTKTRPSHAPTAYSAVRRGGSECGSSCRSVDARSVALIQFWRPSNGTMTFRHFRSWWAKSRAPGPNSSAPAQPPDCRLIWDEWLGEDRMVKVQTTLVASPRNQSQTNFLNCFEVRP